MSEKLKEIGEREIIDRLRKRFRLKTPQDDCAIFEDGDSYWMITTDVMNFKTHIPKGTTPELAGNYFVNSNLSDIAAMAGKPESFMTAYSMNPNTDYEFLEKFETGVIRALKKFDCDFAGGDLKEGEGLTMTGIATGRQKKNLTRKRSDISSDQIIGVTNTLGRSGSGYVFYEHKYRIPSALKMILDIKPRIREAQIISEHGGKFMMDLSDGLASSMRQMKHDYGVGFRIVQEEIPVAAEVKKAVSLSGRPETDFTLGFGGDYELLFSIDNRNYSDFMNAMEAEKLTVSFIGEAWKGDNIVYDGSSWVGLKQHGYEHFRKHGFPI
ncbi:MAG: thiamine-phosphate kinase [Thermoplasmataceae archaeon]